MYILYIGANSVRVNNSLQVGAWLGFSIMTQCLPGMSLSCGDNIMSFIISFLALLFTLAGFLQMAQWARGKHRNYLREFPSYPHTRTAIVPVVI